MAAKKKSTKKTGTKKSAAKKKATKRSSTSGATTLTKIARKATKAVTKEAKSVLGALGIKTASKRKKSAK